MTLWPVSHWLAPRPTRPSRPTSWRRSIRLDRHVRQCRLNNCQETRGKATLAPATAYFNRERSWRDFALSWSWVEALSPGFILPRKSTWEGGSWRSRYRGPMVTSRGSSRGSSMLHIVPVHSVYDDPATGHRFLCMPYFGGADLARVLRASGGLVPTRHNGGSLVKALDQVSRKPPESVGSAISHKTVRRPRPLTASQPRPHVHGSFLMLRGIPVSSTASRFRGLLSRFVGTAPGAAARPDASATEREDPSRQFLRSASAIEAAVWIVERLAEGLEHAHDRGLLHRDLKPSNILLAADGTPMLLDFNLAVENPAGSPEGEIQRALIGGTLPYMSPEHIDAFNPRGQTSADAVDERSDIYALGLIFFELLAGTPPFPDPPAGAPMLEILDLMIACRRRPPSLRAHCPEVPWSLDALAAKCLAFDPAQRYARAADLAEDLRRFLDNLPMKHGPEPSIRERMGKFARRHPGLCGSTSIALLATLLIGLLGGAVALIHDKMQDLSARVQYRVFDQNFTEIQFLLNTADRSNQHLLKGLEKATQAIAAIGDMVGSPAPRDGWVQKLTPQEGQRLREQLIELMMLEARARISLASQQGEEERRRAIERAIDRLDRAERIDRSPPSALFTERARYHSLLDHDELRAAIRSAPGGLYRLPVTT